ncbi:MAG: hypothetical protein WDN00_16670 [Limisphaerales bacterium]
MKTITLKITALSLFAAALMAAPVTINAQDTTNAPAISDTTVKHKKHDYVPFRGKLVAVDKTAMTLKVGERTFEISSETKISKASGPATLADGVVGEMVSGAYKKGKDGKLMATSVHFGPKPESDQADSVKKKKKKVTTDSSTNAAPSGASVPN